MPTAPIVLAFSGGLDTSFCVPFLRETYGQPVHTVTVNTGGVEDAEALEERALALGAETHHLIDGRVDLFEGALSYLIKGNVLRGQVYPLCVGPERAVQARKVVEVARNVKASAVAHGSTGAGNDQVRFDTALRLMSERTSGPGLDLLAPIRENELSRAATTDFLKTRGFSVPPQTTDYSINRGLWGTTIGGKETHSSASPLPPGAYPDTVPPTEAPDAPRTLTLAFEQGRPTALDGTAMAPVALVEALAEIGGAHGVGRGMHVGDTILGIKGRVGFEAPAPVILIEAHRELEKIVLTQAQRRQKERLAEVYGTLLHEGHFFDPVRRDIEAFLDSSQATVTGTVTVELFKGHVRTLGCESPFSMMDAGAATYGEEHAAWDGRDAQGFARLYGQQALLAERARRRGASSAASSPNRPQAPGERVEARR